jgi:hypothetical protein
MSFNINAIKIILDTNIPKKEPIPFTKSLLYNPLLKKTDNLNEYPYLTLDAVYPKSAISILTYEQKVEFFFNKEKMNLRLRQNVELPEQANEMAGPKKNTNQPKTSTANKEAVDKIVEDKKREITEYNETKFPQKIIDEIKQFETANLSQESQTKINTSLKDVKDIKSAITLLESAIKDIKDLSGNGYKALLEKSKEYILKKNTDRYTQLKTNLQTKYIEKPTDKDANNQDIPEDIKEKIIEENTKIAEEKSKETQALEKKQKDIEAEVTKEYAKETEDTIKDEDIPKRYKSFMTKRIEEFQKILKEVEQSGLTTIEQEFADKIKAINKANEPDATIQELGAFGGPPKQLSKNEIGKENIMFMIKCLFPTSYPTSKNISDSFTSIIEERYDFWSNLEFVDMFPPSLRGYLQPNQSQYSYLKIDSKIYTITQVVWVNDIYNHTKYKKLIENYKELSIWKNEEIEKINSEIEKKRKKFQTDFKVGGNFNITKSDIAKLQAQKVPIDENIKRSTAYAEKLEINEKLEKVINYIEQLNTYIEIIPPDYTAITDIANNINENYTKISSKLSTNSELNKKFKELNQQIESINILDKINDNYISKPGINMNFEKDEAPIKDTLKSKYSKYTNFSSTLSEFIKPKLESTNLDLQRTFNEFLDNTDPLRLFNAIMNPLYIKNVRKYLSTLESDGTISEEEYKKRMDTGISILEGNEKDAKYEIILRIDVIAGEIKNDTQPKINCLYQGESLGDTLEKLINAKYINKWELNPNRFFFDLTENLVKIEKEEKESKKMDQPSKKLEEPPVDNKKIEDKEKKEEIKGGKFKYNTRKFRSHIIKTRKYY